MNQIAASIVCALILGGSFTALAADSADGGSRAGRPDSRSVWITQNDFTITCPDRVTYQAQPVAGWSSGTDGIKQLKFTDATVNGRVLYCNYAVPGGGASTLMREMPAGYVCTTDSRYDHRNWQFHCKRPMPPIKTKPKS